MRDDRGENDTTAFPNNVPSLNETATEPGSVAKPTWPDNVLVEYVRTTEVTLTDDEFTYAMNTPVADAKAAVITDVPAPTAVTVVPLTVVTDELPEVSDGVPTRVDASVRVTITVKMLPVW